MRIYSWDETLKIDNGFKIQSSNSAANLGHAANVGAPGERLVVGAQGVAL